MAKYYDATPIKIKPPVDPKNPEHYVNNAEFKEALLAYAKERDDALAAGKEKPQVQNYIAACFMKIAKGLGSKHNFRNYSYLDDMISDAVFTCLKNIDCFDASRGTSAFAYFTQCVWFSFLGQIKDEKKKEQTKRDLFFKGDFDTFDMGSEDEEFQMSYTEYMRSLGTDTTPYESKEQNKRKKFEAKKSGLDTLFGDEECA